MLTQMPSHRTLRRHKRRRLSCPPCGEQSFGGKLGALVGNAGQSLFKSWTGIGDYDISTNSLVTGSSSSFSRANPSITQTSDRSIRIKFKEYVGDVFTHPSSAGAFFPQAYSLNPGLLDNFPWLAPIANEYQQWKPKGLLWEFISTSGDITSTQALGKIIIATDYNTTTLNTSFENEKEMLAEAYNQESVPTKDMVHGIECDPSERTRKIYFVRAGAIPTTASLGDFDLCQTTIATVGGPAANTNLGSLWLHYDIEFFKNQLFGGVAAKTTVLREYTATNATFNTVPFGTDITPTGFTQEHGVGAPRFDEDYEDFVCTPNLLFFPRWAYVGSKWKVEVYYVGDSTASVTPLTSSGGTTGVLATTMNTVPLIGTLTTNVVTATWMIEITINNKLIIPSFRPQSGGVVPANIVAVRVNVINLPQWYTPS